MLTYSIIVDMGGAVRGGSMAQSQASGVGQIRTTFDWAPAAASPTHASNCFLKRKGGSGKHSSYVVLAIDSPFSGSWAASLDRESR